MPAESSRLRRPLGPRDRRLIAAVACVAAATVPAAVLIGGGSAGAGCTTHDRAGFRGSATVTVCLTRRTELTHRVRRFKLDSPMPRPANASKPSLAFVARIRLR